MRENPTVEQTIWIRFFCVKMKNLCLDRDVGTGDRKEVRALILGKGGNLLI